MELKKYKLGDCLELQRGYDLTSSQMQKGEVAVVGSNGIIGYHDTPRGNTPCITVGRSGSVGKVHYYERPTWAHNTALFVKDFKGNDPKYLYYYLKNLHLDNMFEKGSSVIPSLDRKVVHSLVVPFHKDRNDQRKIATILSTIDKKIELNRQINDNLEAMAKQLYDYWFVQFDFPNEVGKPYKSSGGAMVWNEKLKRKIPQGLDATKIGDIEKNIITGKTPSCADDGNFGGDIPFVTIDDIRGNLFVFEAQRTLSTKGADSQEQKYLPIGSLSVSCIGTIGIMGFVARLAQTNQQINSIVFKHEYNKEFLYFSLKLYFENTKAKTGNVFANMSKEEFASIIVAYPPKQILQAFHNKVAPIFDSIKNNIEEINSLTKQRDELLPLLMNGQATVNYHLSDD